MKGIISDHARLSHIKECIDEIETALKGYDYDGFCNNHVLRIAIVKWLEIIGEATNHITNETKDKYPSIEWQKIIGLRNIVVHEYFRIDYNIIWDAATHFLGFMKKELETINLDETLIF